MLDDAAAVARRAAQRIARRIRGAVARQGFATAAFSGGKTPAAMLAELARMDLPWEALTVYQVDERLVSSGDPRRNAALLDVLPLGHGNRRQFEVGTRQPRDAVTGGLPAVFDIVHLGMGADGHTASWPPGDPVIDARGDIAYSGEYAGTRRVTITPAVVNRARWRIVVITGADKTDALRAWLDGADLPIQRVTRTATTLVVDAAAWGSGAAG